MPVVNCFHQGNTVNALATLLTLGIQIYNLFERGLYNACFMFQLDVFAATKPATRPLRSADRSDVPPSTFRSTPLTKLSSLLTRNSAARAGDLRPNFMTGKAVSLASI
ncbi:hypothetical protein [Burkholderia cepacia]|uniref:hypothetical protein n=1 Tax=Burkholderia cepacia TaxID=292 RepID=UPI000F59633C|nr:hypothetical protein [Burkholderia cepacia]RQT88270.1 hypothetical protein DF041_27355 [Burkholderia cepacia]